MNQYLKPSKVRYWCPSCGLKAWAKPEIRLVCKDCDEDMREDDWKNG